MYTDRKILAPVLDYVSVRPVIDRVSGRAGATGKDRHVLHYPDCGSVGVCHEVCPGVLPKRGRGGSNYLTSSTSGGLL